MRAYTPDEQIAPYGHQEVVEDRQILLGNNECYKIVRMSFKEIVVRESMVASVPRDIDIAVPTIDSHPDVDEAYLHSLAYIPWSETYLAHVPKIYREFFRSIRPKLAARTTDVHTALSVSFVDELIWLSGREANRKILTIALLLHDIGWARLSPAQIAKSLNYSAFAYSDDALVPKRLHASLGAKIAEEVIVKSQGALSLTEDEIAYIVKLVRHHDQIDPWPDETEPIEYLLLSDADRLWSYTRENFWLDTIRKNTDPHQYLKNISEAIDGHFLTEAGRTIARRLVAERAEEVAKLHVHTRALAFAQ